MTDAIRSDDPSNFEPVQCVCGWTATTRIQLHGAYVRVEVSCDHGGAQRSTTSKLMEGRKFDRLTVQDHAVAKAPIAILGGAKLGDGTTWQPRSLYGSSAAIFQSAPKPSTATSTSSPPVTAPATTQPPRTASRRGSFPRPMPADKVEIGDVVMNTQRTPFEHAVVLALTNLPGSRVRFTVRRLGDDKYMSFELEGSSSVRVVADVECTRGDPDRWRADGAAHEQSVLAEAARVKAALEQNAVKLGQGDRTKAEDWHAEKARDDMRRNGIFKDDIVRVLWRQKNDGSGMRGIVAAVNHLMMGSSSLVTYDVVMLEGSMKGKHMTFEPHQCVIVEHAGAQIPPPGAT